MTEEEFAALVADRHIAAVRDILFEIVRAWRPSNHVRLVVWPEFRRYSVWVEYDNHTDLSGHAAVEKVRGEGADFDAAVRDCVVKWFVYARTVLKWREKRVEEACRQLARDTTRRNF